LEAIVTRRHFLLPLLVAAVFVGLGSTGPLRAAAAPQAAPGKGTRDPAALIKGKWQATVGGKPYTLDLRLEEGSLVGTALLPNRKTVEIEDGIFVVDEFSFTTVEDDIEWEWSGTISDSGLEGVRERADSDAREEVEAKRRP
jgi:hypothetical protein